MQVHELKANAARVSALRFRSLIQIQKINPYVLVSAERAARIRRNWRRPLPVRVRVNGKPEKPWRINMMPAGDGTFYLYLHGEVRKASNTKVGDTVTVELEFDDGYKSGPAHPIATMVQGCARPQSKRPTCLGPINSEPSEGGLAVFFLVENRRCADSQLPAGDPRFIRRQGPIYGEIMERLVAGLLLAVGFLLSPRIFRNLADGVLAAPG